MRGVGGPARPGRAGPPEAGGGAGPSGAGPCRGRGRAGGGRSGGLGAGVPPRLRVPRGLLPRDARAEGAAPGPRSPEGCAGAAPLPPLPLPRGATRLEPPSQRCQSARKLRSCRFPAGITHPVGTCRCFLQAWAETPATTASPRTGPLGAPRPPGQRLQPGREPRPRPGCLDWPPQHLPREGASFLPFTFRRYLEGIYSVENSPHPHGFPRVLISGPGAPSIPVACKLERSWEGGMEEPRLGCA